MPLNLSRSLLTVILPGMVAIRPWVLLAMVEFPRLQTWYEKFTIPFHIAAFGLAVIAGCAFEELGNYLEKKWDISLAQGPKPETEENWVVRDWHCYLSKHFGNGEPVAYRYLSRKVTALYFELGMMCATPVALAAIALLIGKVVSNQNLVAYLVGVFSVMAAVMLWLCAKHTHALLCEVRHFLANPQAPAVLHGSSADVILMERS